MDNLIDEIIHFYNEPSSLSSIRKEAYNKFLQTNYPESRYTRFKSINFNEFSMPIIPPRKQKKGVLKLQNFIISDKDPSYKIKTFHQFLLEDREELNKFFQTCILDGDKFQLFLSSFWQEGIYIKIIEKALKPLHILIYQKNPKETILTPIFIDAEKEGGNIILEFRSFAESQEKSLHISLIMANIRSHSNLSLSFLENWSSQILSINKQIINVENDAKFINNSCWLGGKLVHMKKEINIIGRNAEAMDLQILFGDGKQHFDIQSSLNHKAEWTKGEVMVRGVLKDEARSVFYGLAKIRKDAQNADSFLSDHMLVLSSKARADTIPALEIEADQVRASHSASIGQIDEEQIFYLACRGLQEEEAEKLILEGFLEPAISKILIKKVKNRIIRSINDKMRTEKI